MKILAISDLYPPYYKGGYELGCKDVVDGLIDRGHTIWVVTSVYGCSKPTIGQDVYRILYYFDSPWQDLKGRLVFIYREIKQARFIKRLIKEKRPDVIFVWGMVGISRLLLQIAEEAGPVMFYCISGEWIIKNWDNSAWFDLWQSKRPPGARGLFFKKAAGRPWASFCRLTGLPSDKRDLKIANAYFTSNSLKDRHITAGYTVRNYEVIYWGVSSSIFYDKGIRNRDGTVKLLYSGRLHPQKGIDAMLKAIAELINKASVRDIVLDIFGKGEADYEEGLKDYVRDEKIERFVNFCGHIPRNLMPDVYNQHDILIFPSVWEEPFSITLLEAMSCGMAVIATDTGGTSEVLKDGVNSLIFPPDDYMALAFGMRRLIEDINLRLRLAEAGQRLVQERFTFEEMLDRIENFLIKVYEFEFLKKVDGLRKATKINNKINL